LGWSERGNTDCCCLHTVVSSSPRS
jgi:hypothetical protein